MFLDKTLTRDPNSGGAYTVATPAAAAMRSTLRRLREIAEV